METENRQPQNVRMRIETLNAWCVEVLKRWVEDDYIVSTWTEVALNRDWSEIFLGAPRVSNGSSSDCGKGRSAADWSFRSKK